MIIQGECITGWSYKLEKVWGDKVERVRVYLVVKKCPFA